MRKGRRSSRGRHQGLRRNTTTTDVDYAKYLAYAGLAVDLTATPGKGAYLGVNTGQDLLIADVSADSPAAKAGIHAGGQVEEINGAPVSLRALSEALNAAKPGDHLKLNVAGRTLDVELAINPQRTFAIAPLQQPAVSAQAIFADWLRSAQ